MRCVELSGNLESEWAGFCATSRLAGLAHDIAWQRIISHGLGCTPRYLVALDDYRIRGVLPLFELNHRLLGRRLVSVPVLDRAGILADDAGTFNLLEAGAIELSRSLGAGCVQLRCTADIDVASAAKAVLVLDILPGSEAVWASLRPKVRNQVRKAEKSGLKPQIGGMELLSDFFRVYSRNMRDLGVPTLPFELFRETVAAFGERARVILVCLDGEAVGACILLIFRDTGTVPWASSSRKHFALCPNNLLYWSAIREASGNGCTLFDFGRSTPGTGPFAFKQQWGAVPLPLDWQYLGSKRKPNFTTDNPRYQVFVKAWQKLPVPVANLLGPLVSKQVA